MDEIWAPTHAHSRRVRGSYGSTVKATAPNADSSVSCTTFNILAPIYKRLDKEDQSRRESHYRAYWLSRNRSILDRLLCERSSVICLQEVWVGNEELVEMYERALGVRGGAGARMGRPPHGGGPVFRFIPSEVAEMEACLQESNNAIPDRALISSLAEKFSASAERGGKMIVQPKQVWNWFQNRRYAQRAKMVKVPGKLSVSPTPRDDSVHFRNLAPPVPAAPAKNLTDDSQMEFEAKSARDGAWYDVAQFISHRMFETGDPEVRVRFAGFGVEEDEWVNVRKCVRQRSFPCEASECVVVLPGDLILCFQEGKEQALYFDAHVLDAQRRRHDARGCRCRFLVRYDHDQSEEIVPLRKVCRRPETEYRLRILQATKAQGTMEPSSVAKDAAAGDTSKNPNVAPQREEQQRKVDTNSEVSSPVPDAAVAVETVGPTASESKERAASNIPANDPVLTGSQIPQEGKTAAE